MKNIYFFSFLITFALFSLATLVFSDEVHHEPPPPPPVEEDSWAILLYFHGKYLSLDSSALFHVLIEASLVLFIVYLFFQRSYKPGPSEKLTPSEIEQLIQEWEPEPLVSPQDELNFDTTKPITSSESGQHITVDGKICLNFGTGNFLGLSNHQSIKDAAVETVKKYGVGTCGPRGFYGTIDTHLNLEKKLAEHMGSEETVIYSSAFNTISSVIPAFSGRGDIIICDKGCSFGVQLGVQLSRSEVHYFEHNNLKELEDIMKKIKEKDIKTKRKLTKRFIVVEGIYQNYGDICPLDKLVELRKKYCYRLYLDDSIGFGTIGQRGILDYFNIPSSEVEVFTSSMANSLGSVGGFVTGSFQVGYHQRLNSLGYVFSASSPPYLVVAAHEAIDIIEKTPELLQSLQQKSSTFRATLKSNLDGQPIEIEGFEKSPLVHLRLQKTTSSTDSSEVQRAKEEKILKNIVKCCWENGVCVVFANYCEQKDQFIPRPSIKIYVNNCLTDDDILSGSSIISDSVKTVLSRS